MNPAITAACVLLLVVAPAAGADLPAPDTHRIRPPTSIGGIRIGDSYVSTQKAWGGGGSCTSPADDAGSSCVYYERDPLDPRGQAIIEFYDRKVARVGLFAGRDEGGQIVYETPLRRFKTTKGIRIGSREGALRRAYRRARKIGGYYYRVKSRQSLMTFQIENGRIWTIELSAR